MSKVRRIPATITEKLFALLAPAYQCDINCILELNGRIDSQRLTNAFLAALAEEPMWSHRFVASYWRPSWEPIPRADRPDLMRSVTTDSTAMELDRIMRGPVDAAARLFLLRGPADDTLCFRLDHRLADATAARLLIQAVAEHYAAATLVPAEDAPVVRRTVAMLDAVVDVKQRRENLQQLRLNLRENFHSPFPYPPPVPSADDPVDLPPLLHFPDGALNELRQRAQRDRVSPTFAVLAATYLALRDVTEWRPDARMKIGMAVNIRRYLPAKQQPCPASIFFGRALFRIDAGTTTMPAVMERLRNDFERQRGPNFGLVVSELSMHVPIVRMVMEYFPFGWVQRRIQRAASQSNKGHRPDVQVSDVGDFGRPGDPWGDATLRYGYCTSGCWGVPGSVTVNVGHCGSRLTISVSTGPRSFAEKLAAAIRHHLCEYVGWPEPSK